MAHDAEIHTLAAPYALHALPVADIELFERHLADCSACRGEVDDLRETSARLGSVRELVPPAAMKVEVMARIAEVRPLPPEVRAEPQPESPLGGRWRQWWPRLAAGAVAALVAVVAVLGVQLAGVRDDLDQTQASARQVSAVLEASDAEIVRASADGSAGTVAMARSVDAAIVVADGMAAADRDHTYQLWFIEGTTMRSAGLLGAAEDGRLGPFAAEGLDDSTQLGITLEPAGGSEQPTTDPVMVFELPT